MQRRDGFFEMRKRPVRQTAEIDDIGALIAQIPRSIEDLIDGEQGGIDDLSKDRHILLRKVEGLFGFAEKFR